jgi:hypothetical protein
MAKTTVYIDPDDGEGWVISEHGDTGRLATLTNIYGTHSRMVARKDLAKWVQHEVDPLVPDQMRVTVILPHELRDRSGHESFTIPLGGGRIEASVPLPGGDRGDIAVEVYPEAEFGRLGQGRTRSYDHLQRLRDEAIATGGYIVSGDEMVIGKEIIGGRDQLELLRMLARHWGEQVTGEQKDVWQQGYDAGKRAVAEAVKTTIKAVGDGE